MKTTYLLVAFTALAGTAFAQLNPLPPKVPDSMIKHVGDTNYAGDHWDNPLGLGAYRFTSDLTLASPKPGHPDNVLGLNWTSSPPASALAQRAMINGLDPSKGGSIRAIFLGESAGWLNDFGFTYSGKPQSSTDSFTVFSDIQAMSATPYPVNIHFGDYIDVPIAKDSAPNFDFWLNGVGANGVVTPGFTSDGGVYTAFNAANSNPANTPGNVMWTEDPIWVSTYYPAFQIYANTATYLVSFEDWRTDRHSDDDYNDYMFAIQFVTADPRHFDAVPEPSTYGLFGVTALVGLLIIRRFNAR